MYSTYVFVVLGVDPELRFQDSETGEDVDEEPTEG